MKAAVTGHSGGLGKAIADRFARDGQYRAAKAALDAANLEINSMGKPCRVSIVRPNWLNSPSATQQEEDTGVKLDKLDNDEVADIVAMIVDLGPKITIPSITLTRTIHRLEGPKKSTKWWRRRS